jgi:hypothetical protein
MHIILGADILGFGFNILGEYNTSSITSQLFTHKNTNASQYTYSPTSITYQVPDNISVNTTTQTTGGTQVFNTRQQFQNNFAAKAGLSGSYGGFSGEFNLAYSQTFNTDSSYYYGLSEANFTGWELLLTSQSAEWMSDDFTEDPIVENLSPTFTPENREQFFEMFRKFGTHFISQVTLGGSLSYYVAVEQSFSSNEQEIQANLQLEYKAVFVSAKASAEAEWSQLGQSWANSRIVKVNAVGGDTNVLNALGPGYGDSDSSIFTSWSTAVMQNPGVILFKLTPLSQLFSGDAANAVAEALEAYTNGAIVVNANADLTPDHGQGGGDYTTSSSIIANGTVIIPNPPVPVPQPMILNNGGWDYVTPIGGFQIALFDANTIDVIMSQIYYQDNTNLQTEQHVYTDIMRDIHAVREKNYICAVSAFAIDLLNYPSTDFATWLTTCGAGLAGWKQYIGMSGTVGLASYACIGKQGLLSGTAIESFAMSPTWLYSPINRNPDIYSSARSVDAYTQALLYAGESTSKLLKKYGSPKNFGVLTAA